MTVTTNRNQLAFAGLGLLFLLAACMSVLSDNYIILLLPFGFLFFLAGWNYKELLFFALLASLPFSMEYQFSENLGTDFPDEALMIAVSFFFLAFLVYRPAAWRGSLSHPLLLFLYVYLCWLLLTVFFSGDWLVSLKYFLAKSWYLGAFVLAPLAVFHSKKKLIRAAICLLGALFLVICIILFRHYQSGFRFADASDVVQPFFRNHVNYSAMLVCLLPAGIACYCLTENKRRKAGILLALIVALAALFFSYARGAWLAAVAGLVAYGLLRRKWLFAAFLFSILLVAGAFTWFKSKDRYLQYAHHYQTTIFHKDFSEHLVSTYRLRDLSTAERFYRWVAGVRMIKDNWLTGYGPNTFYENYKPYAVPVFKTWVSDNPERSTVHNYFLLLAIEQGLPGLLFFLLLLGALFWYAQQLYHRVEDRFWKSVAAVAAIMLSMLLVLNFLSDLVETDKAGSLFYACLALLVITDINTRKKSEPPAHVQRVP